jgi:hypothetical protein
MQVTAAEANLNFDMTEFYTNFVTTIADHNTNGADFPDGVSSQNHFVSPMQEAVSDQETAV